MTDMQRITAETLNGILHERGTDLITLSAVAADLAVAFSTLDDDFDPMAFFVAVSGVPRERAEAEDLLPDEDLFRMAVAEKKAA